MKPARMTPYLAVFVVILVLGLARANGATAQDAAVSPEQQLAERFAPIAELRQQEKACDRDGEGYFPAPVEVIIGNPEIALKQKNGDSSASDTVVMMGPTAQDLVGKDESYYLDFPGDPHRAGCRYETDFKRYATERGLQPTVYAHIFIDQERGQLALQYWLYWYFNQWNNTHESDWEMVQLIFDTTSVSDALAGEPSRVGFAQHGGGESAEWSDDKLQRDGDHIIIHPGAGSHGTYYGQDVYIGWGENGTGFGCDNTTTPVNLVPLTVVLLSNDPDPSGPFAWLLYDGRWGERQESEWNGPKGPFPGKKWNDPIGSMANWRTSSLAVPASNAIGPNATGLFCDLSAGGSRLVTAMVNRPPVLISVFLGIIGLIVALFVVRRRALREAFGLYASHFGIFVGIGLFTIPIGIAFNGLAILVSENPPMEWVIKWFNDTARARLTAVALVGVAQQIAMVLLVAPPIIWAIKEIRAGQRPTVGRSFLESYRRLGPLVVALAIVIVVTGLLGLLVIGIPIGIWLAVRWAFFGQAVLLDEAPTGMDGLRMSSQAVRGRWWQALIDNIVFQIFAILPGPFVGALLMLLGKTTVEYANAFSSIVYALTVPIQVIGLSLAYARYQQRPVVAQDRTRLNLGTEGAETAPA